MSALRGWARTHAQDESGVSLVELLVTIALLAVLGGMVFSSVVGLNRAVAVADSASFDQGFGRNAYRLVTRDLRAAASIPLSSAPAFQKATRDEVAFTALLGSGATPDLVRIVVDGSSQLVVTQTPADPASTAPGLVYDAADEQERYVASFIVNPLFPATTDQTIYRYFDADGDPLEDFTGADGGLTLAQRNDIASVEMTLRLNQSPLITGATELTTTVRLPNAGARD